MTQLEPQTYRPLVLEATALPTEPQPLPLFLSFSLFLFGTNIRTDLVYLPPSYAPAITYLKLVLCPLVSSKFTLSLLCLSLSGVCFSTHQFHGFCEALEKLIIYLVREPSAFIGSLRHASKSRVISIAKID